MRGAVPSSVRLRPTREADLSFVLGLEADPETAPFLHPWPVEEVQPVGFVILRAVDTDVVELKRIAISGEGKGYGRHALKLVKRTVFDDWGARRLWLDVYDFNARARSLYQAEGFVAETTRPASEACGPGAEGTAIIMALEKSSPAFPRG